VCEKTVVPINHMVVTTGHLWEKISDGMHQGFRLLAASKLDAGPS
jgi:hypothetical protein